MSADQNLHYPDSLLRDFEPAALTERVVRFGEAWADQDAAASMLEEARKSVLATLVLEYSGSSVSGAMGERPKAIPLNQAETRALADPRYQVHLELMVKARQEAHRHRVRYDMGRMELELVRSKLSTLRQEMYLGSR